MNNFYKGLVEVESLLNQLDAKYKDKIPYSFWNFINENKDPNYKFNIDFSKTLEEQSLLPDTIAILTYINIKYLLSDEQKSIFNRILLKDTAIAELKKKEIYNIDIFNKRNKN